MSKSNGTTPTIREDLAEWFRTFYPPALEAMRAGQSTGGGADEMVDPFPDGVPAVDVKPFRRKLSEDLSGYLLDLRLEQCTPGTTAGNRRGHVVTVHLVAPRWDAEETGELDAMVSGLLDAITTTSRGLRWTTCEFAIRDDSFPAYAITLNLEEAA